jgi:hypothetical protein
MSSAVALPRDEGGVWCKWVAINSPNLLRARSDMKVDQPWHSLKQNVHHDNTECQEGKSIAPTDLREGTGGRPACERCVQLNDSDGTRR